MFRLGVSHATWFREGSTNLIQVKEAPSHISKYSLESGAEQGLFDAKQVTLAAESRKKSPTIYIVEEDNIVREGLARLCRRLDAEIKAYASVTDLLEVGRLMPPGCLVAEVNLPKNEGTDLLRLIHDGDVSIPVIFLSSGSDIETAVEVMRQGAFDFIEKPFLSRKLLYRIEEAVRTSF